jgi:hypothetical protein
MKVLFPAPVIPITEITTSGAMDGRLFVGFVAVSWTGLAALALILKKVTVS